MSTTASLLDPPFRQLVRASLARYGVRPRRLRRLAAQVVRVAAAGGGTYALRCRTRLPPRPRRLISPRGNWNR